MKTYKYKIDRDQKWIVANGWGFPAGVHPNSDEEVERRKARKPLSAEKKEIRRDHMVKLHQGGASYALIGKLYRLDGSLVRKIVNGER